MVKSRRPPGSWRRPGPQGGAFSLDKIFFWSYAMGIPVIAVGSGLALLVAFYRAETAVHTYDGAPPCAAAPTGACYAERSGTIERLSIERGSAFDKTTLVVQLPDATTSTWAKTTPDQEGALHSGAPLQAKIYNGKITSISVNGTAIETVDSPTQQEADLHDGLLVFPILGLGFAVLMTVRPSL